MKNLILAAIVVVSTVEGSSASDQQLPTIDSMDMTATVGTCRFVNVAGILFSNNDDTWILPKKRHGIPPYVFVSSARGNADPLTTGWMQLDGVKREVHLASRERKGKLTFVDYDVPGAPDYEVDFTLRDPEKKWDLTTRTGSIIVTLKGKRRMIDIYGMDCQ